MINQTRPTSSIINAAKVSFGETWATIETTWATETRTWLATGSLFTNAIRPSSSIINIAKPA